VARRLETLGRPNGSGLETLAERNADRRPLANRRPLRHLLPVRLPVLQSSGGHYPLAAGTQNGCEPVGSARVYRMNPQLPR
jgi:hypothetical protein